MQIKKYSLYFSFLIALFGTLGSLYFSEVQKFAPCPLCWYQRICLYPLVLIFGTAIWTNDRKNYRTYALPLLILGLGISLYHNLVYVGIIPEALTPCTKEISCSSRQLELFGFITIPLLSFLSFFITATLVFFDKNNGASNEK